MSHRHPCPGRCNRNVPNHLFACRSCWRRLPRQLQRDITRSYRPDRASKEHAAAMLAASEWYAGNPA